MAINDFSCICGTSVVENTNTYVKIRVTCYWKNNSWTYKMNYQHAWVSCNGSEVKVMDNGSIDTTSNQNGQFSMGSHDFTIYKNHSTWNCTCGARLQSNSTYASGSRTASNQSVSIGAKPSYTVAFNANGR